MRFAVNKTEKKEKTKKVEKARKHTKKKKKRSNKRHNFAPKSKTESQSQKKSG